MVDSQAIVVRVAGLLAAVRLRLVLVESCTAGNVSGALAVVPGISNWLCGSLVVYRNDSKHQWLDINQSWLDDPQIGPVSQLVTRHLALSALQRTPEADMAVAVTGHVGPGAPPELDGLVFCVMAYRTADRQLVECQCRLQQPAPSGPHDLAARQARLHEATDWVLSCIAEALAD